MENNPRAPGQGESPPTVGSKRDFDWGPESGSDFEGIKEWAVYALLIALLIAGVWFIFDSVPPSEGRKSAAPAETNTLPEPPAPEERNDLASPAAVAPNTPEPAPPLPAFKVQLGAFSDQESAAATLEELKDKGFAAVLSPPDEQYEMYRIHLGPFGSEAEAEKTARKLNEMDFPCFVLESQ